MFSHTLLKRFIKDYSLPIQIVQEPYFTYYVNLYDDQFHIKEKLELLKTDVAKFKSEDDFLHNYYDIRDNIIKTIEMTDAYAEYNSVSLDKFNVPKNNYSSHDIFNRGNVGKYFLSIDLKKANFQALKWYNKEIVLNCETYEELIGKFTDSEYMKNSKYLREVIFGNMNPKRQIKIERFITEQILNWITCFTESDIKMVSGDEIVLELSIEDLAHIDIFNRLSDRIKEQFNYNVDIEIYQLKSIGDTGYFVKQFINKSGYELKCIPLIYHAQVFKKYNNIPLEDNDLIFFHEGQLCKFLSPISFNEKDVDCKNDNC